MLTTVFPELSSSNSPFPPESLGLLRDSTDLVGNFPELRRRFEEDGYLFLPGFLDREAIIAGRRTMLRRLADEGVIVAADGPDEALMAPGRDSYFRPDLADAPEVQDAIYSPKVMEFYDGLFGEPALHYDFTWLRAAMPGVATMPHYDIVYMGRGSKRVCTAWIPFSDIDFKMSGLAVLEGSNHLEELRSTYGTIDVDTTCSNKPGITEWESKGLVSFGALPDTVGDLAARFGLRWLVSEYRMGDFLTFSMFTLHCSTDNNSDRLRLSTDSRYQPAADPTDERWVGASPLGHGEKAKREKIC